MMHICTIPGYQQTMNDADLRHAAISYLRAVLNDTQLSPTGLAKKAGIASTTITRFLNDPEHKFELSQRTLGKIAAATGINFAPFFEEMGFNERSAFHLNDESFLESTGWDDNTKRKADLVLVVGEVAAGAWRDVDTFELPDIWPLRVRSVFYDSKFCFGLFVRGTSLNKIASDGDILFCVSVRALRNFPVAGSLVIVERRDPSGKIEVTAKRLQGRQGAWELWPESTDPRWQEPIRTELAEDGDIRIVAEVECIYRETGHG